MQIERDYGVDVFGPCEIAYENKDFEDKMKSMLKVVRVYIFLNLSEYFITLVYFTLLILFYDNAHKPSDDLNYD